MENKNYISFNDFIKIMKVTNIQNLKQFMNWDKPTCIPNNPSLVYTNEWVSWSNFLTK